MATLPSSITTYLNQWLKIASGGRVVIHQHVHGWAGSDYIVFRCETCKDNWHVGVGQFYSVADPVGVPSVLQDWVNKHRHVCPKYIAAIGMGLGQLIGAKYYPPCGKCEWPYGAHQESWIASVESKPEPKPDPKSFWIGKEGHKATCSYVTTVATGTSTQNCDCGWVDYCSKNFQLVKDKVELELIALQAKVEMAKIKYDRHDTRHDTRYDTRPKVELIEENVGRRFRE